jgi:beta-ribofuranosylaminobenzene 5'-phosphate synthase
MQLSMPSRDASRDDSIAIRSHGRIHFGLLEISESQPNCFGGIGLMVDDSNAILHATVGVCPIDRCEIFADSYWKQRIEAVLHQWLVTRGQLPVRSITADLAPKPHQGLGSGTQMASAVGALLMTCEAFLETRDWELAIARGTSMSIESLSRLSQRGKRSNIGLCGFLCGGFIVDLGRPMSDAGSSSESRTGSVGFPNWPVLIIRDPSSSGDSGSTEAAMFDRCRNQPNPHRQSMLHLVHQEILPAIAATEWARWNDAMGKYGTWAGKIFEPVQGGIYRSSQIAKTVAAANKLGLLGAVQSSWGPTVCAVAQDESHAIWCISRLNTELPDAAITMTSAANRSAQVSRT